MKTKFCFLLLICIDLSIVLVNSRRIFKKQARIQGGQPGKLGQFPYQAAVWVNLLMIGEMRYSGGVFFSNRHVLTSASILYDIDLDSGDNYLVNSSDVSVAGGETQLEALDNERREEYGVTKIIVHEDFDYNGSWDNCIAILILDRDIEQNAFVRSIELIEQLPEIGTNCLVSGFGTTVPDIATQDRLFYANVTIINTSDCVLRQSKQLEGISSEDHFLCATEPKGGNDLCLEDEGGPLVCSRRLAGIALSPYGYLKCHPSKLPGFYISVLDYANWIKGNSDGNDTGDSSAYKLKYNFAFIIIIKLFCSLM